MATLLVGPTRPYTTIQAAVTAANDNPATRGDRDLILIDAGTYTETIDARAAAGGWLKPIILRGADPTNRPVIASTGATQAVRGDSSYRGTAGGEIQFDDLIFSGWTGASNGVLYIDPAAGGIVVQRCHFTGNTGRICIRWIGGDGTRLGLADSCTFGASGLSGSGAAGLILVWTAYSDVKNCVAICPTNVQFINSASTGPRYVEHNSVVGTWNTGGNAKVCKGNAGTFRGNVVQNLGTGAAAAIEATGGTYTENVYYGTFTTAVSGTDGGGNQNADPLFTNTGTGDLTLQVTSPGVRSLARSANTLLTILGASRSDPTDAGAYEAVLDSTPPTLVSATMTSPTTIVLVFSEALATSPAQTAANYTTSPTRTVTAVLSPTTTVTLTLSSAVDSLRLTIGAGVTDLAGNAFVARTVELAYSSGATSGGVSYTVSSSGASVAGFPGWDPIPSGAGSEMTLERLVFASLFSDARLSSDLRPPDGSDDRRGWWGDSYTGDSSTAASLLWQIQGGAGATARQVEDVVRDALLWMITDRLCSTITVRATVAGNRAGVVVEMIVKGEVKTLAYPDLWSTYAY